MMRIATFGLAVVLWAAPAVAQPSPCTTTLDQLSFDPYSPSDLAIVRNYGGAVLAQASVSELLKLDPNVPIEGELLRQLGRAIPAWVVLDYGWPPRPASSPRCPEVPAPAPPQPAADEGEPRARPRVSLSDVLGELPPGAIGADATAKPITADSARGAAALRNRGISIEYDGRTWVSAGPAVRFSDSTFVRIGERAGFPIFRPAGGDDRTIYVTTAPGMVAPFRAMP